MTLKAPGSFSLTRTLVVAFVVQFIAAVVFSAYSKNIGAWVLPQLLGLLFLIVPIVVGWVTGSRIAACGSFFLAFVALFLGIGVAIIRYNHGF